MGPVDFREFKVHFFDGDNMQECETYRFRIQVSCHESSRISVESLKSALKKLEPNGSSNVVITKISWKDPDDDFVIIKTDDHLAIALESDRTNGLIYLHVSFKAAGDLNSSQEPDECLIISSDEEDENDKSTEPDDASSTVSMESMEDMNREISEQIVEEEPEIMNESVTTTDDNTGLDKESEDQIEDPLKLSMDTLLSCRSVRIGSYKYIPAGEVTISHNGLRLGVPLPKDVNKLVTVDIKCQNIVRVSIHFGRSMPVLFFYTTRSTGSMLREVLEMQDPQEPYFDPASRDATQKSITLLPYIISEESKATLSTLYKGKLKELTMAEANVVLSRASPKVNAINFRERRR